MKKKVKIKIAGIQHYSLLPDLPNEEEPPPDEWDDGVFVEENPIDISKIQLHYGREGQPEQKRDLSEPVLPSVGGSHYELTTTGSMTEDEHGISIEYDESELTGMKGSKTRLFLLKDGCVTLSRTGSVSSHLVFENGRRHICTDSEEVLPFWICIATNKISNTVNRDGGSLAIDYFVEISGERAEHNEIKMTIF